MIKQWCSTKIASMLFEDVKKGRLIVWQSSFILQLLFSAVSFNYWLSNTAFSIYYSAKAYGRFSVRKNTNYNRGKKTKVTSLSDALNDEFNKMYSMQWPSLCVFVMLWMTSLTRCIQCNGLRCVSMWCFEWRI